MMRKLAALFAILISALALIGYDYAKPGRSPLRDAGTPQSAPQPQPPNQPQASLTPPPNLPESSRPEAIQPAPTPPQITLPLPPTQPALTGPMPTRADRVVIDKKDRRLTLYAKGKPFRIYGVALGRNPVGHKQQEGDKRTPEGRYTIDFANKNSAYHLSLRVSYPNAADKASAKARGVAPGGDIMIHGLPNGYGAIGAAHRQRDWTDGCIALTNQEMDEVWRLVAVGTPVEINP